MSKRKREDVQREAGWARIRQLQQQQQWLAGLQQEQRNRILSRLKAGMDAVEAYENVQSLHVYMGNPWMLPDFETFMRDNETRLSTNHE